MGQVQVEGEITATLDDVWKLVSDFVGFPAARGMDVTGEGQGVGMTRSLNQGTHVVVERLEALDEGAHRLSYSIVSGPVPVTDYFSTIALTASGPLTTHIVWSSTFTPAGISEQEAEAMFEKVYGGGIAGLQKLFPAS